MWSDEKRLVRAKQDTSYCFSALQSWELWAKWRTTKYNIQENIKFWMTYRREENRFILYH